MIIYFFPENLNERNYERIWRLLNYDLNLLDIMWKTKGADPDAFTNFDMICLTKNGTRRLLRPGQPLILNDDMSFWKDAKYLEKYIP